MRKLILSLGIVLSAASVIYLVGADHIDAPAVGSLSTGSTVEDITDYYAFESPSNSDNYVFVANVAGLTAPGASVSFSDDTIVEFNIDSDGDNVEDQLIQVFFRDGKAITYGVVAASAQTGLNSEIVAGTNRVSTDISAEATVGGVSLFAGLRDDPFFMDFFQFVAIVDGVGAALGDSENTGVYSADRDSDADTDGVQPYPASFNSPGADTFAGSNVLSVVVEVPKSAIGDTNGSFNSWVETKSK